MARGARTSADRSRPTPHIRAMDTTAPFAMLLAVTLPADAIGIIKGQLRLVAQHQFVGLLNRVAVVAPAKSRSVLERSARVKGHKLTRRGVGFSVAVTLRSARKGRKVGCSRHDLDLALEDVSVECLAGRNALDLVITRSSTTDHRDEPECGKKTPHFPSTNVHTYERG